MKAHKRKNNGKTVWWVRIPSGRDDNGNYIYKSVIGKTSKEAMEKAEAKKYNLHNDVSETQLVVSDNHYNLSDAYDELYRDWQVAIQEKEKNPKRGLDMDTVNRYESNVNGFFKIVSKETKLSTINKKWVRDFIRDLKSKKWEQNNNKVFTDRQAQDRWRIFGNLMDSAVKSDFIEVSVHKIFQDDAPSYKSDGKEAIDEKTMSKISRHFADLVKNGFAKEAQAAMCCLLEMYSGIRWGEAAGLPYKNVDWNTGKALISQTKSSKQKKGEEARIKKITKGGALRAKGADKGERFVYVSKPLLDLIGKCIPNLHNKKPDDLIFDVAYKTTQEIVKDTGEQFGVHLETKDFRRFFATQMKRIGVDRDDRKLILGHNSDKIQDTYITYDVPGGMEKADQIYKSLN
jgi:integrase|tara:strand:- start:45 stop:1250 length:1206 start_codon:yes stop_codon:yes gene_type:complete